MNYQRIYDSIVNRAKSEGRIKSKDTYYEAHHIIPSCLGGEGRSQQWKTHPNIVLLTGREHFLCHWLLHAMYPDNHKLAYAFSMMCNVKDSNQQRYTPSSRIIEYIKKIVNDNKRGPQNWVRTQEYKDKISDANKGKKRCEETKDKLRNVHLGKTKSEEHKEKIRRSSMGKVISEETKEKLRQAAIRQHERAKS
jgi:hypothetical protein